MVDARFERCGMAVSVLSVLRVSQRNFQSLLRYMLCFMYITNIRHTICKICEFSLAHSCSNVDLVHMSVTRCSCYRPKWPCRGLLLRPESESSDSDWTAARTADIDIFVRATFKHCSVLVYIWVIKEAHFMSMYII